ncbi:Crp/Fnr family transcriptional regulator [Bradyrhizobium sp. 44]|uniref:Crp/Fnr family transcriptional regulator n=1 Tax=unclassified Bradyrhizobium TaxID=2631580 RepID=UPI001FF9EF79|nr:MULTISPECIES: Crp/Fnr family transcriptional regulator [unclassified Bradyrhizobium]MCK1283884.1 Crp/Fnr family transcriptional regulator [Bradyrhizobium sp. 44]MCK1368035.1 Crp/Fnr family transcriptional regulator [Bradyrhizobium sp. 62]
MDHYLGALTDARLAFIPHEALQHLMQMCPRVAKVFWRNTLIDAAVFREWILGMGRRSAATRIAHVLYEIFVRLRAVDPADERECESPVTQAEIDDAPGLSTVHVNRSLQELRGADLISLSGGVLAVLNWSGLREAGEFDPKHLHLDPTEADKP